MLLKYLLLIKNKILNEKNNAKNNIIILSKARLLVVIALTHYNSTVNHTEH